MLIVNRRGVPANETAVEIKNGSRRWIIDPQREIFEATTVRLSRHRCIMDFVEGLAAAGQDVVMHFAFKNQKNYCEPYRPYSGPVGLAYFFCGYALGQDVWERTKSSLQENIVSHRRLMVLEHTAAYYLTHQWERIPSLIIP